MNFSFHFTFKWFPPQENRRERERDSKKRSHRNRSWSFDRTRSWSVDHATAPNPRSHQSHRTLALARLRRLSTVEIVTQSSPLFSFSTQSSSALPRSRTKANHQSRSWPKAHWRRRSRSHSRSWLPEAPPFSFPQFVTLSLFDLTLSSSCSMFLFWFLVVFNVYFEIFYNKICLDAKKIAEKMWKICKKIAFLECYQTPKIVFRTIFHCITKHSDFIFLTGIHFPLHSFYSGNSIYIEPNAA